MLRTINSQIFPLTTSNPLTPKNHLSSQNSLRRVLAPKYLKPNEIIDIELDANMQKISEIFGIKITKNPLDSSASTKTVLTNIDGAKLNEIKAQLRALNNKELDSLVATISTLGANFNEYLKIIKDVKNEIDATNKLKTISLPNQIIVKPEIIEIGQKLYREVTLLGYVDQEFSFKFPIRNNVNEYPVYLLFNDDSESVLLDFRKDQSSAVVEITEEDGAPRMILTRNQSSGIIVAHIFEGLPPASIQLLGFDELLINPDLLQSRNISSAVFPISSPMPDSSLPKTTYSAISTTNLPQITNSTTLKIVTLQDLINAIDDFCKQDKNEKLFDYFKENLFNSDKFFLFNNTEITAKNIADFKESISNLELKLEKQLASVSNADEIAVISDQISELKKVSKGLSDENICDDKKASPNPIITIISVTLAASFATGLAGFIYKKCKANQRNQNQDQELRLMNQPPIDQAIDSEAGRGVGYQSARARGNQPARDIKPQSEGPEIKASLLGQSSRQI
jgi:hypothetical protein